MSATSSPLPVKMTLLRRRYERTTREFATRLLGDPFEADEVVNLAFLEVRELVQDVEPEERLGLALADATLRHCLKRTGCVACADDDEWAATGT